MILKITGNHYRQQLLGFLFHLILFYFISFFVALHAPLRVAPENLNKYRNRKETPLVSNASVLIYW